MSHARPENATKAGPGLLSGQVGLDSDRMISRIGIMIPLQFTGSGSGSSDLLGVPLQVLYTCRLKTGSGSLSHVLIPRGDH
jgi:hypothetical protein